MHPALRRTVLLRERVLPLGEQAFAARRFKPVVTREQPNEMEAV